MTMLPIWKTCPKCHKKYDWNPDVGINSCPYCQDIKMAKKNSFLKLFGKKKDEGNDIIPDEVYVIPEKPGRPHKIKIKIDK